MNMRSYEIEEKVGLKMNVEEEVLHEARVREAIGKIPSDSEIEIMGARFKCLSEPSRLKILFALAGGELCVDHLVAVVGGTQSAVSHQLKTLRDNKIIKCRRDGKKMLYSVSDMHIIIMAEVAKEHLGCDE